MGYDETIRLFKNLKLSRCIDLCFSNRISGSIINLDSLKKLNSKKLINLVYKFFNDCYLMDQQGCSSPQVVFWLGKKNSKVIENFWKILADIVEKNYEFDLSLTNKKTEYTSELVLREKKIKNIKFKNLKVVRYQKKSGNIANFIILVGLLEVELLNISQIKKLLMKDFKTLTYYGLKKKN